jgi:hypothetical protein
MKLPHTSLGVRHVTTMGTGVWLLSEMMVSFQKVVEFRMLLKARVPAHEGHGYGGRSL